MLLDIIKIVTIFVKTKFKDSRKVKTIRNYVSIIMHLNAIYIYIF